MEGNVNTASIRQRLSSPSLAGDVFPLAKELSLAAACAPPAVAQELLLRALERRAEFGPAAAVLDGLAREAGLFPYLDPGALALPDAVAYEFHTPTGLEDTVFHRAQAEVYRYLLAG